jgi:hypothetical protein
VTVEIALELSEQVRDERMKIACRDTRANVRKEPALHCVIDLASAPVPLLRRTPAVVLVNGAKQLGPLRKDWLRESLRHSNRLQLNVLTRGLSKQLMEFNVETKGRLLFMLLQHK